MKPENKLDDPAWYALLEKHENFSTGNDLVKRYLPSIAPFVACHPAKPQAFGELVNWVNLNESFFMTGDLPVLPPGFTIISSLLCVQMVCTSQAIIPASTGIVELGEADATAMHDLVQLVQPGYYLPGTRLMGNYAGIFSNGKLVAMAGERMRMNGFTEISAVVTHPEFTGRKYAQQLISHLIRQHLALGNVSFLHAAASNKRAVDLYSYLGFTLRRMIYFHSIRRDG